jgi:hypothetical protein
MDLKEHNWKNLCANHLRDWYGLWIKYGSQGEVIESFQCIRSFCSNQDQSEITHTNRYIYTDGKIREKTWKLNKHSSSLPDGLVHPAIPWMKSFLFEQGACSWVTPNLELNSMFTSEFIFKHEELRNSLVIVYNQSNGLMQMVYIREDTVGFSSKHWSTQQSLVSERNLSGNWHGTSVTMTPDLKVSAPMPTQLHWGWEGQKTFFFPDGMSLSCPSQVKVGTNFSIAVNWLVTPSQAQQMLVNYDESGTFSALTLGLFHNYELRITN